MGLAPGSNLLLKLILLESTQALVYIGAKAIKASFNQCMKTVQQVQGVRAISRPYLVNTQPRTSIYTNEAHTHTHTHTHTRCLRHSIACGSHLVRRELGFCTDAAVRQDFVHHAQHRDLQPGSGRRQVSNGGGEGLGRNGQRTQFKQLRGETPQGTELP